MIDSVARLARRYRADEGGTRYCERSVCLAGWAGGVEVRPTRVFLWLGSRTAGREWVYSLGSQPRLLRRARRRRHLDLGPFYLSFLGNPLLTLGLFLARVFRRLRGS